MGSKRGGKMINILKWEEPARKMEKRRLINIYGRNVIK